MPLPEIILWTRLKGRQLGGYKFRRQHGVKNFIMDFYFPELKLAIEIDGDSHCTDDAMFYDQERQEIIQSYGIQFLRFTNKEICNNLEGVIETIGDRIKKITTPTPPRQGGDMDDIYLHSNRKKTFIMKG